MTFTTNHALALLALLASLDERHASTDQETLLGKAETWAKLLNEDAADPAWVRGYVERAHREPRPYGPLQLGDIRRAWGNQQRVEAAKAETAQRAEEQAVDERAAQITDADVDALHFLAGGEPNTPDWFEQMAQLQPQNAERWGEMRATAVAGLTTDDGLVTPFGRPPSWFAAYRVACDEAANWPAVRALGTGKAYQVAARVARSRVAAIPVPSLRPGNRSRDERERACGVTLCACPHEACRGGWLDGDEVLVRRDVEYPQVKRCPICVEAVEMKSELTPRRRGRR